MAVAIIIDNYDEDVDHILMSDDGAGGGIMIPSMMISEEDGEELIHLIEKADDETL